eukprot:1415092-Prymnesium_polylepis.1
MTANQVKSLSVPDSSSPTLYATAAVQASHTIGVSITSPRMSINISFEASLWVQHSWLERSARHVLADCERNGHIQGRVVCSKLGRLSRPDPLLITYSLALWDLREFDREVMSEVDRELM